MNVKKILLMALAAFAVEAFACTSAIVSGKLTANGRPLLWKNRDTNDQNNRVKRFAAHKGVTNLWRCLMLATSVTPPLGLVITKRDSPS